MYCVSVHTTTTAVFPWYFGNHKFDSVTFLAHNEVCLTLRLLFFTDAILCRACIMFSPNYDLELTTSDLSPNYFPSLKISDDYFIFYLRE